MHYLYTIYTLSTQYLLPEGLAQLVELLGVEQLRLGVWPSLVPAAVRIHTGHQLLGYQWIPEVRKQTHSIDLYFQKTLSTVSCQHANKRNVEAAHYFSSRMVARQGSALVTAAAARDLSEPGRGLQLGSVQYRG